MGASILKTSL